MTLDKSKYLPFVVFFGGVGYTIYPHLDPPKVSAKKLEPAPPLEDGWFSPKPAPTSTRDPFIPRSAPSASPAATDAKGEVARGTVAGARRSGANSDPSRPELEELRLTAVALGGRKPAAIINGKVYVVGDRLDPLTKSPLRWEVIRIDRDGVDLADEGRRRVAGLALAEIADGEAAKRSGAAASTKSRGSREAGPEPARSTASRNRIEQERLREVLGPASNALDPLPPGLAENLGRMLGADLKNGDLGALEGMLGAGGDAANKTQTPVTDVGGKP
ncbi:MAG: hypothetical protein SFX72_08990 [Isosphaeraceae bacterium]|nr:hypothetical protein [Isosphaeraceae bacterium]